jgi:DNA polymerase-4
MPHLIDSCKEIQRATRSVSRADRPRQRIGNADPSPTGRRREHRLSARGIDNSEVVPDRPTQSISAEDTFQQDVLLAETEPMIRKLAGHTWAASRKESRIARTVVLKLKTSEFKILTRSHTPGSPPASCEELTNVALSLRERVGLSPHQRFRLVGVGLSNFSDPDDATAQPALFA